MKDWQRLVAAGALVAGVLFGWYHYQRVHLPAFDGLQVRVGQVEATTACQQCWLDCMRLTGGDEAICTEHCRRYCQ